MACESLCERVHHAYMTACQSEKLGKTFEKESVCDCLCGQSLATSTGGSEFRLEQG